MRIIYLSPSLRRLLNYSVSAVSVFFCLLILPARLPGIELLRISPHWLLIWVVAWSVKRKVWESAIAGLAIGWLQDGMTGSEPSHALSLMIVGILTAVLQKQKYIEEDFVSIALIVFAMSIVSETITAIQYTFLENSSIDNIWLDHQRIALTSAILNSLWAPALYYPLNYWWEKIRRLEQIT